jgi:hypothetical protein
MNVRRGLGLHALGLGDKPKSRNGIQAIITGHENTIRSQTIAELATL